MALTLKRLNQIPHEQKCTVFGYIRKEQNELSTINIPLMIMYLCLGYFTEPYHGALLSLQQALTLKLYDKIDFRCKNGKFVLSTIIMKHGTRLKIQYARSYSYRIYAWIDAQMELYRLAKPGSISERPAHRLKSLKVDDFVDIKPFGSHSGWRGGIITKVDKKSGQVRVGIGSVSEDLPSGIWVHLDNEDEIEKYGGGSIRNRGSFEDIKQYNEYLTNVDYSKDGMDEIDDAGCNDIDLDGLDEIDDDALGEVDGAFRETDGAFYNELDNALTEYDKPPVIEVRSKGNKKYKDELNNETAGLK